MEVTNRFKGLDLIESLKSYTWEFITLYRRQWSKPSPWKRTAKKAKWLSEEALQIAEKKEVKSKGKIEIYTSECRVPKNSKERKKAFLSDQCKEIEEINRLGKTRDLFREGNGNPLQYSCLENPMDGGAWKAAVHGVAEGQTRLSDFTFTFHFNVLEKEMATHSSVLAWRIPGMGKPGGLPSMGSHIVGHDWSDLAAAAAAAAAAAEISSRKLEIPREHFMQRWAQ